MGKQVLDPPVLELSQTDLAEPVATKSKYYNLSYDQALQLVGGFGIFQYAMTTLMILNIFTGILIHTLPFLESYPDHECQQPDGTWASCEREHICSSELQGGQWRIDYTSPDSWYNFVDPDKLDLTCTNGTLIGLIGSAYFIGFGISCIFVPRMGDLYGRRITFLVCMWLQTVAYMLVYYTKSLNLTVIYFGIIGICQPGRLIISTMIMCEYSEEKRMPVLNSLIHGSDTVSAVVFIALITLMKNYIPFFHVLLIYCFVVNMLDLFIPESAKFYLANHRYQDARSALYLIARINRSKVTKQEIDSIVFDVQIKNHEQADQNRGSKLTDEVISNQQASTRPQIRLEGKLREVL